MHSHKVKNDHSRTFNIKSYLIIGVKDRKSEKEPYYVFFNIFLHQHTFSAFMWAAVPRQGRFSHTNEQRSFSYCKTLS